MASTINASTSAGLVNTADTSGVLQLQTANTTALTVDGSQNIGIGTTSPSYKLDILTGGGGVYAAQFGNGTAAQGMRIVTGMDSTSSGITTGGGTRLIQFDGTNNVTQFYTNATERMRINSNGNVGIGTASAYASVQFYVGTDTNGSTGQGGVSIQGGSSGNTDNGHASGTSSGATYQRFIYNASVIGSITQNGTTGVLYNLTSDYRLKNNPVALTGAKDFVMALQPKTWDWWDNSGKGVGFIAHEFMEVAKYSGNGTKDEVDADGKPVYQSIQPSSSEVMANIVALMQEQQATITAQAKTINALTARVVALEGK